MDENFADAHPRWNNSSLGKTGGTSAGLDGSKCNVGGGLRETLYRTVILEEAGTEEAASQTDFNG